MASEDKPNAQTARGSAGQHTLERLKQEQAVSCLNCVLHSKTFSTSDSIRQILKFIVEKSVAGSVGDIKEYTIATEALGRSPDFDPKADNIVRVQMQRLRRKLDEYYSYEGAQNPIRIVIPRGHYKPEFHSAPSNDNSHPEAHALSAPHPRRPMIDLNKMLLLGLPWGLVFALLVLVFVLSVRLPWGTISNARNLRGDIQIPTSLGSLWKPFLPPNSPPLIVYGHASLMMNNAGDLDRHFLGKGSPLAVGAKVPVFTGLDRQAPLPPGAGSLYYIDLNTGTGEVIAAARIAQLLGRRNQDFSIKRSRDVSFYDLRSSNVIVIGAKLDNSVLGQLPVETDLIYEPLPGREVMDSRQIRDRHPALSQPETYHLWRDAKTGALEGEYALISFLPGVAAPHCILVLGGISTVGTQAAAEFALSPNFMALLEQRRSISSNSSTHSAYFQALLRVQIRDEAAAKTDCLLVRDLHHN